MEELYLQIRYRFTKESDVINAVGLSFFKKTKIAAIIAFLIFAYSIIARFMPVPYVAFYFDIPIFGLIFAITLIFPFMAAALMFPAVRNAAMDNDSILSLYQTYFTEQSAEGTLKYSYSDIKKVTVTKSCITINAGSFNAFIPAHAFDNIRLSQVLAFMQSKGANIPASTILNADSSLGK